MATEQKILDVSMVAAEDLSADQYKFVVRTSTGCRKPTSVLEIPDGVLQGGVKQGGPAVIRKLGISKVQTGGAIAMGGFVQTASDGRGVSTQNNYGFIVGVCLEPADTADDIASVMLIPPSWSKTFGLTTVTNINNAGAGTYSAAALRGGFITRDTNGGSRTDTTGTAATIVASIPGCIVGSSFEFTVRNTAGAAETITVAGGTGVTMSGTATIAQGNSKRFLLVVTNSTTGNEAVTVYSLGTVVH